MLKHLTCTKAAGSDGIPPLLLRLCETSAAGNLTQIINESLRNGVVPDVYKLATVCPVFKSGNKCDPSNYRPVSLLPVVSKLLEKIVHRQLVRYIQDHAELHILPDEQFAYRRGHSCEDALTLVVDRWMTSIDKQECVGVVFVDMSKAFDRVRHQLLLNELRSIGIGGVALEWFASYLQDRRQSVRIGRRQGEATECTRGVPQGSVLGPLLFSLYVRHVPGLFEHAQSQQYADDIAFYLASKSIDQLQHKLTSDLNLLQTYLESIGLILNPVKTKFMVLRRKPLSLAPDLAIACGDVDIPPSPTARYLGLIIDEHLTFEDQVDHVCTSVYKKIGVFRRCRRSVDHATRRIFYVSLIQSTIEYASNSYVHCLTAYLYSRLVTLSHTGMKKAFGLSRRTQLLSFCSNLDLRIVHVYSNAGEGAETAAERSTRYGSELIPTANNITLVHCRTAKARTSCT